MNDDELAIRLLPLGTGGRAVKTVEAEEGAAYGAALLAGVGAGAWPSVDAASDAVVQIASTVEPNAESIRILDQQYEKFRRVYPALKGLEETGQYR